MEKVSPYLDAIFRWVHVVSGIAWIGLLYFFNFVNASFAAKMDGETKKKVVPELLPRALFWFRWGAAYTWISGLLLLAFTYYHGKAMWDSGQSSWGPLPFAMLGITFLGVFVYDALVKSVLKPTNFAFWGGWLLVSALYYFYRLQITEVGYRGAVIHIGSMFGTFMAFNVWFRIWPAQQQIITAIKNGQAPNADLVALAGLRSKHNTYMSIPLVFMMLNQHNPWMAPQELTWSIPAAILIGWLVCYCLYQKAGKVQGF
ncbi:MAG TPA: urate hydroxylase PuuD [Planctomycetota bacterium]|mgnify:CR=1 FL=1|jgi:uncharacterized membrane protein|nr:urate hydroxylase PuuD [Planctomycetota bacterium]